MFTLGDRQPVFCFVVVWGVGWLFSLFVRPCAMFLYKGWGELPSTVRYSRRSWDLLHRQNYRVQGAAGGDRPCRQSSKTTLGSARTQKGLLYLSKSLRCLKPRTHYEGQGQYDVRCSESPRPPYFFSITWNFLCLKTKHSSFYSIKTWRYLVL